MSSRMQQLKRLGLLALAGVAAIAAGNTVVMAEPNQEILDGARKEGRLIWYDSTPRDQAQMVVQEFNKKYPEIDIEYTELPGAAKLPRILQESAAGGPTADVMTDTSVVITKLVDQGYVNKIDWKELNLKTKPEQTPNDYMIVISGAVHLTMYNTNNVKADDIPQTYEDLLDPKWEGRVGMWQRPVGIVSMYSKWGEEKVLDFATKLAALKPRLYRSAYGAAEAVGAGEVDIGLFIPYHSAYTTIEKGAPAKINYDVAPIGILQTYMFSPKEGRHPNAAKLFMSWLGSSEGALVYEKASGRPNIYVPESGVAQMLATRELSQLSADEEAAKADYIGSLETQVDKILQGR